MSQPLPQTDPRTRDIDVLLCALSEPLVEELQADSYLMRGVTSSEFVPRCNINVEPDGSVDIILEVPGFRRDQLEICVSNGVLTMSGKTDPLRNHSLIRRERPGGCAFSRHFRVSPNTTESDLSAWHEDGLLTVRLAAGHNHIRPPKATTLQAQAQAQAQTHKVPGARSPPLSLPGSADRSSSSGGRTGGSDPRSSSLTTSGSNERSSGSNCSNDRSESNDNDRSESNDNDRSSPSGSGSSERPSPSGSGSGSGSGSNDPSDRSGSNDRSPPTGPGQPDGSLAEAQDRSSSPTSSHTSLLSSEGSHHNRARAHHHHHHHHKRGRHSFESSSSSSSSEKRRRHAVAAAAAAAVVGGGGGAAAGGGGSVGDALSRLVEADGCATPSRFPW